MAFGDMSNGENEDVYVQFPVFVLGVCLIIVLVALLGPLASLFQLHLARHFKQEDSKEASPPLSGPAHRQNFHDVRIVALQNMLRKSFKKEQDTAKELEAVSSNLASYHVQSGHLGAVIKGLNYRIAVLNLKAESWEEDGEDLSIQIDHLQFSKDDLRASYEHLTEYSKTIEERNENLEEVNLELMQRNEDVEQENVNWKATWNTLKHDKMELKAQLTMLQDSHAQLTIEKTTLQTNLTYVHRISATNARHATLSTNNLHNAESKISDLEDKLATHRHVAQERHQLTTDALAEINNQRATIAALQRKRDKLAKTASKQSFALSNKTVEIVALRAELSHRESAFKRLECRRAARDGQVDAWRVDGARSAGDDEDEEPCRAASLRLTPCDTDADADADADAEDSSEEGLETIFFSSDEDGEEHELEHEDYDDDMEAIPAPVSAWVAETLLS